MLTFLVIIVGLVVFEAVNSIDNAIVNAHVLKTMSAKARRWFLIWGILTAVVVVRGVLPLLVVWLTTPGISLWQAVLATFGNDPIASNAIEANAFVLLLGGGMFLMLLYFHWLFLENKEPFFLPDKLIRPHYGVWFFAVAALLLVATLYFARANPFAMLAAAVGNALFFILYGFRETAEREEKKLEKQGIGDLSKLMYLEVLDLSFSIDGVVGAFAFTTNVLFILIGNGIGALIVREFTLRGIEHIGKYKWLKNGAMTSIGFLGFFMMLKAFGVHVPEWLPTIITFFFVGVAFWASHAFLRKNGAPASV